MDQTTPVLTQYSGVCNARRKRSGKIKIGVHSKSNSAVKILITVLLGLTVYAFISFDYKEIVLGEAIAATLRNVKTVFLEPKLSTDTFKNVMYQLFLTFCLGTLSTIFGAIAPFSVHCFVLKILHRPVWQML